MSAALRVRRSIQDLQDEFDKGNKKPLEDLMRAWKGIKELPPNDPRSFFVLGGYHGEPFRGAGWGNAQYWGGYCNHGNILFPTWHRVYLLKLEDALRSIPGCADVTLPFWDETSEASLSKGIPTALTQKDVVLDGQTIPNPLRSFVFPHGIVDHLSPIPDADYSKPKGYETVRYPLSGLVGTEADRAATEAHNAKFPDYDTNVGLLNENIRTWLSAAVMVEGKPIGGGHVRDKYAACLNAPNYTVFSNTTSAAQWFDDTGQRVVPLESPHNSIHLAVGGFDLPNVFDASPIDGANGDMGENDTAGLDPIFFFHHCFVDRVFWLWQKKNGFTDRLEIIPQYPGTNSVDSQGPTPGTAANAWLTLDSPLDPFRLTQDGQERPYTSQDCTNIETQLGYTYGPGSLEQPGALEAVAATSTARTISVRGLNRARIRGSFLISAFATVDGKRQHIGTEAILSRWHVEGCANCQTHVEGRAAISTHPLGAFAAQVTPDQIDVQVRTRDGLLGGGVQPLAAAAPASAPAKRLFKVELR
ncbi:Tyrosinase (Monophenol monooxygenase) [Bradyrhizobium sp. ORS 285]|uniref:tyrosinase family protein n=1 Tax=Bradyrhizobium sp. ORS 285 TaxID=115808 RepID=UPI00024072A5|nr:tyrosinase family protein [Bradyrhizobium sp. ORS 285]CCD84937.1 Tyrosinase (Monophenol monooxygenase) [Bradyrhizobium sp. ORS 285]SMX62297.1 Tyrosinase (Monophenol monooxygenase) [Bradyrhizobium sp. ORS 285]